MNYDLYFSRRQSTYLIILCGRKDNSKDLQSYPKVYTICKNEVEKQKY